MAYAARSPKADALSQMKKDELAMGLSAKRITALIASVYCGSIVEEEEIIDEKYGSDPSTYSVVMIKRKAKTGEMFMELMAAKDHVGLQELFANLISSYNERGCTGEISVLTAMKTELDDVFAGDPKSFLEYIRRYVKKYRGRAFPVIKGIKTNDTTSLRESVDAVKKSVTSMQSKVDSLNDKLQQFDKIVKKIPLSNFTKTREGGGAGSDRQVPSTFKCRHCGEVGAHWSNLCPTLAEKKEGEKDE